MFVEVATCATLEEIWYDVHGTLLVERLKSQFVGGLYISSPKLFCRCHWSSIKMEFPRLQNFWKFIPLFELALS